jgi:hypothetical protein
MKTTKVSVLIAALAGSMLVAGAASANVTATSWQFVSQTSGITATVNGNSSSGTAGVFQFNGRGGSNTEPLLNNNPVGSFLGICLEFNELISPLDWDLVDLKDAPIDAGNDLDAPMGAAQAADLKRLLNGAYAAWSGAPLNVTALQLAVWEIANEATTAYNLASGNFFYQSGNDAARNVANGYLANVMNGTWNDASGVYYALVRNGAQDFVVKAVPIPAAAWLLGSGLLGLFGLARRKRQVAAG